MKLSSLFFCAVAAVATVGTVSCSSSGSVDVKYPTVQQMDDMDVQWGLTRRKPRGTPSRSIMYDQTAGASSGMSSDAGAIQAPAMRDPELEPAPSTSLPPRPAPAPTIPDQLR